MSKKPLSPKEGGSRSWRERGWVQDPISTERPAPLQHKAYAAARRLGVGPAGIGEAKEFATLKRGFDGLRTPGEA